VHDFFLCELYIQIAGVGSIRKRKLTGVPVPLLDLYLGMCQEKPGSVEFEVN